MQNLQEKSALFGAVSLFIVMIAKKAPSANRGRNSLPSHRL